MPARVVLDANVLYSARLRDLWMELGLSGLVALGWTDRIEREWMEAAARARPGIEGHLRRTAALMRAIMPDALITGFEALEPGLTLPDADDRHVLAAAVACRAEALVTFNLDDFPAAVLARCGMRVRSPDAILIELADKDMAGLLAAVRTVRARLKAPPVSASDYASGLARAGCPRVAALLAGRLGDL